MLGANNIEQSSGPQNINFFVFDLKIQNKKNTQQSLMSFIWLTNSIKGFMEPKIMDLGRFQKEVNRPLPPKYSNSGTPVK